MNMRKVYNGIILVLIAVLVILLYFNFRGNQISLSDQDRMLFIGKKNLVAVYEDKLAVDIPFEIHVNKELTFGDLVKKKEYEEVLRKVNDILPEKIEKYAVVKYGEIEYKVKNAKKLPETTIDEARYALASSIYSMFDELYREANTADVLNQNIIVDVLNANGKGGYARKTGELLTQNLSMKYNAANYEKNQEESYIILNDISVDKARDIVMTLPEKYFKIQAKPVVPTLANVVIVLGKENNLPFSISIEGTKANIKKAASDLKKAGYKGVKTSTKTGNEKSFIEYQKEDYFIAYKIAKILEIQDMVEKDSLSNKIEIHLP
ncbi:LytR C-terminal domain-containing protein [Fusobacterium necrophorum]|uniref:LytR C-terminal domain-containing protein n=1 Tax=Fusobacterium necrophorum TaxID=859 RepID=UPI0025503C5B|nr:LytR C-terminal domain-containing protein [Fusobacterium necrophorum]MDK4483849.1 LytR C-terminal domain-containing protein [Fusobacterium necrophorum]MDK4500268.1 LytR C-terminal domain-containing protein [Fusobacterium necrophorum]MDK4508350.1 LytR C-terminal domain-containing protein [Fusobacterium necrophorum]MDK4514839.1 LytR C-terminal domain-containing protein [Fusobacterium necrophorum]MDK4521056.1 LytR C-terminal domain-containing protein [Fusobacterium necrophorum]